MSEDISQKELWWYRIPAWLPMGMVMIFALLLRFSGLTRARGLFRDDAWMALTTKVPLSDAFHMLVSAPGYTLVLRWWLSLHANSTLWAQIPALAWGLLGVASVMILAKIYGVPRWAWFSMGIVVAASPVAIAYSVRLKPYAFELVAAALLLAITELVRRGGGRRWLLALAVCSGFAVASSLSLSSVVAGCWLALAILCWKTRRLEIIVSGALAVALALPAALWTAHSMPSSLGPSWSHYMLAPQGGPPSWPERLRLVFGGYTHGLLGVPMAHLSAGYGFAIFMLGASLLIFLLWLGLASLKSEALAPALVLGIAGGLCLAGYLPLGTGRTDEVLYPATLVLVALGMVQVARLAKSLELPREFASALLAAALSAMVIGGVTNHAWYPSQREGALYGDFKRFVKAGQAIVVEPKAGFTWAHQGLTTWKPVFDEHYLTGFAARSTDPNFILVDGLAATQEKQMDMLASRLQADRVVWYVGISASVYSPSDAFRPHDSNLKPSPTWYRLLGMGFKPSYRFSKPGTVAVLMLR